MLAALVFCMIALVIYIVYHTRTRFPKQDEPDKAETAKVVDSNKQLRLDTDGDDKGSGINIGWSQIGSMIASKKDIMSPVG